MMSVKYDYYERRGMSMWGATYFTSNYEELYMAKQILILILSL